MTEETPVRHLKSATFPESDVSHERVAAIFVTKDDEGKYRTYTQAYGANREPDPEVVAMLAQSIELRNL